MSSESKDTITKLREAMAVINAPNPFKLGDIVRTKGDEDEGAIVLDVYNTRCNENGDYENMTVGWLTETGRFITDFAHSINFELVEAAQ